MKDDKSLRELKVTPGAKMMVVGSTIDDVMTVQPPSPGELKKLQSEAAAGIHEKTTCTAEPSCEKLASFHACMGTRLVSSGFFITIQYLEYGFNLSIEAKSDLYGFSGQPFGQ